MTRRHLSTQIAMKLFPKMIQVFNNLKCTDHRILTIIHVIEQELLVRVFALLHIDFCIPSIKKDSLANKFSYLCAST